MKILQQGGWLLSLALATRVANASPGDPAGEVRADGVVTVRGYHEGKVADSFDVYFTARLAGYKWNIRCKRADEPDVAYHEAGADRPDECAYVMAYSDKVVRKIKNDEVEYSKKPKSTKPSFPVYFNIASGVVSKGSFPSCVQDTTLQVLWLALASPYYLEHATNGNLEQPFAIPQIPFLEQPGSYSPLSGPGSLPKEVVFFSDGFIHKADSEPLVRFPAPYDKGFTNAVYQVNETMATGSMAFPRSAQLTVYRRKSGGTVATDLNLLRSYEISITNLSSAILPLPSYTPTLPGTTLISDLRFRNKENPRAVPHVLYATNGWPDDAAVRTLPEYRRIERSRSIAVQNSSVQHESTSKKRFAIVAIVILTAVPFGLILIRNAKQRQ